MDTNSSTRTLRLLVAIVLFASLTTTPVTAFPKPLDTSESPAETHAGESFHEIRAQGPGTEDHVLVALPASSAAPAIAYSDLTPEQAELAQWGVGLFVAAGLELPSITVASHSDPAACRGRDGAARRHQDHTEIRLCTTDTGPVQEWVILHELAHAWDHNSLDHERRQAFLDLRHLPGWRAGAWHERGAENAAEIITWGLMDRPVKPGHIYHNTCEELLAGYVTLTGRQPLHGFTDACAA